jgi:superfamily II DNA or RNA helicase
MNLPKPAPKNAAAAVPADHPYWQLDSNTQLVAQMLAVIHEVGSNQKLKSCLDACDLRKIKIPPAVRALRAAHLLKEVSGQGFQLDPTAAAIATRHAQAEDRLLKMTETANLKLDWSYRLSYIGTVNENTLRRNFRAAYYSQSPKKLQKLADSCAAYVFPSYVVLEDFDGAEFDHLPDAIANPAVEYCSGLAILTGAPIAPLIEHIRLKENPPIQWVRALSEYWLAQGKFKELQPLAEAAAASADPAMLIEGLQIEGMMAFLHGDDERSIARFDAAMETVRKLTRRRKLFVPGLCGIFFLMALIRRRTPESLKRAALLGKTAVQLAESYYADSLRPLRSAAELLQKEESSAANTKTSSFPPARTLEILLNALSVHWTHPNPSPENIDIDQLAEAFKIADLRQFRWVAWELAELLKRVAPERLRGQLASIASKVEQQLDFQCRSVVELVPRLETWERSLNSLENLAKKISVAPAEKSGSRRLAWIVDYEFGHGCESCSIRLQTVEQTTSKSGKWNKGRKVALHRLANPGSLPYLTEQDRAACAHIQAEMHGWYQRYRDHDINIQAALFELAGAPNVYFADEAGARIPLELVRKEVEVMLRNAGNGQLAVSMEPTVDLDDIDDTESETTYHAVDDTPTRWFTYRIDPEHKRLAKIVGQGNKLVVPETAKERLLAAVAALSSKIKVHSDVGGAGLPEAEKVPADSRPHFHLLPHDQGLRVESLVCPIPEIGSHYAPGRGGQVVFAQNEDHHLQTERDLKEEQRQVGSVMEASATLAAHANTGHGEFEWIIEHPEDCLELLDDLHSLGDAVIIAWPQGEAFRLKSSVSFGAFRMSIRSAEDWFTASGEIQIDDDLVYSMKQIMALLDDSSALGRFVKLEDGQFLALTREFRKRLDELRAFTSPGRGDTLRIHPLAAHAVNELAEDFQLKADKKWRQHLKRLAEADDLDPEIPSTLQAELRSYQIDGFRWLARLAHWGVGACLADDMGLGKTIQALALLLRRAPGGPALVVAPLSVVRNWIKEAERFAPTLKVTHFGIGDRDESLEGLGPFDLVLCSYGLLPLESDKLREVSWHSIVFDEAQAIKNAATKRSRTAMKLRGDFRMITTGTPIENHLGELHNLFHFINPGLLGSIDSFNIKFADPIQKRQDDGARSRLKKLIQPFILRRLKNQVLDDLPSRTEIVLNVERSPQETAFYEALRQNALEHLESNGPEQAGQRGMRILAEITKLRRACCNPSLIQKQGAPASAKLATFATTLAEVLANKHKVLVFSQFVDHLNILRQHLEAEGISYQYLDGSTPGKKRQERINAFQAGEGDVFLISLKAGGMGLNLTAADYVIHMDPWWNPAVEDQASDRAHRIGQTRPVTIYRLVTRGTIEEKIVELHHTKRDLADRLLEGSDASTRITAEDMLALLKAEV